MGKPEARFFALASFSPPAPLSPTLKGGFPFIPLVVIFGISYYGFVLWGLRPLGVGVHFEDSFLSHELHFGSAMRT